MATVKRGSLVYLLTMYNRAGPDIECVMRGNEPGSQELHATCTSRLVQMQGATVLASGAFPHHCMLAGLVDAGEASRRLNRMEFAYDDRGGVVPRLQWKQQRWHRHF